VRSRGRHVRVTMLGNNKWGTERISRVRQSIDPGVGRCAGDRDKTCHTE
jgi:hypothetical protein